MGQCKSLGIEQRPDSGSECVADNVQNHMGSSSQEPVLKPPVAEHIQDGRRVLVLSLTDFHTISTWSIGARHLIQRETS